MLPKKWEVAAVDKELAKQLAEECEVDPFLALLAASRGYRSPEELEEYLSSEPMFSDPFQLPDMDQAVGAVRKAIQNGNLIAVYGDYDCDGVTATAIMLSYLRSKDARVISYIPDRFREGYGMNSEAVQNLYDRGVSLILTVDNGISCVEPIAKANALGMKVVVTDHHLPPAELPDAAALVDPHLPGFGVEFPDICGAMVAFCFVCAMENAEIAEMLPLYGDLAAIGTVGDVMPLKGENRCLLQNVLPFLRENPRPGVAALMKAAQIEASSLSASKIAFGLVPRLNSAGRMGDAARAVELLVSQNEEEAAQTAARLCEENAHRQQLEKEILEEALRTIDEQHLDRQRVIVVSGEGWHRGVIGIVASRILEQFGRPTLVFSLEGDQAVGSGRSLPSFSLYRAIESLAKMTEHFGGHELAAGVTVQRDALGAFAKGLNDYAQSQPPAVPVLHLDCKLNPAALSIDLAAAQKILEPFGSGNPSPLYGIFGVCLDSVTPLSGGKHLRLSFSRGGAVFQAMLFSTTLAQFPFSVGDCLDLAVTLDINEYRGQNYLSVCIRDYRAAGIDDDRNVTLTARYLDFSAGYREAAEGLRVDRAACGVIYKYLLKSPSTPTGLVRRFSAAYTAGGVMAVIDILEELRLIRRENDGNFPMLRTVASPEKVDLHSSHILQKLERSDS